MAILTVLPVVSIKSASNSVFRESYCVGLRVTSLPYAPFNEALKINVPSSSFLKGLSNFLGQLSCVAALAL